MIRGVAILLVLALAGPVFAAEKGFVLAADTRLVDSGALKYLLPRFSLKTGVRVTLVAPDADADAWLGNLDGPSDAAGGAVEITAVFQTADDAARFSLAIHDTDRSTRVMTFRDWLLSDIGARTVEKFRAGGVQLFARIEPDAKQVVAAVPTGDVAKGEKIAIRRCGRCHVISDKNRFGGIDSTPSFGALRTLPRWRERFEAFWTLNPHPSFTQVEGITDPFDPERPPPIAPLELTMKEVEAIIAFVVQMKPKDLGPPLIEQ